MTRCRLILCRFKGKDCQVNQRLILCYQDPFYDCEKIKIYIFMIKGKIDGKNNNGSKIIRLVGA